MGVVVAVERPEVALAGLVTAVRLLVESVGEGEERRSATFPPTTVSSSGKATV